MRIITEAETAAEQSLAVSEQAVAEETDTHARRTQGPKYDLSGNAMESMEEVSRYLKSQDQHYDPEQTVARLKRVAAAAEEG